MPSVLWRRLDVAGHDACRVLRSGAGWLVEGRAVFAHEQGPASLHYRVSCDERWQGREGHVHGFVGEQSIEIAARRDGDGWRVNEQVVPDVHDIDFGFTPATNLIQLRRLALEIGHAGAAPAAWLDLDSLTLERLDQTYERRSASSYWYAAPRFDYHALLEVDEHGFALSYPGLWLAEPAQSSSSSSS